MNKSYHSQDHYSLDETASSFDNCRMDTAGTSTNAHGSDIRAVILDYGEVLCLRPTEKQIRGMAEVFGIGIPQFQALYEKNRWLYDRGDLSPDRYWFAFADEPGIRLAANKVPWLRACDVEMWSNTNPLMIAWLEALHQSGLRTALLSNMHADMVAKVRGEFEWIRNFDCAVFSHEVRLAKPELKIYQHCLQGLGTTARETLFIDDRELNIAAARTLGLATIRFTSVAQLRAELEKQEFRVLPPARAADSLTTTR
jgi:putative hydrolase of the HAD superfamily